MIIRLALDTDIPAIVELLRLSLGESLMPKSETFWRWKHIENPFGKSPVLLAFDEEQLIGIRAFMRWEWRQGDSVYRAVRAVDTATHPGYQGKGIFSKLTQQLVEQCREEGTDFIFNTPNKKSMPGYLKMGWKKMGRLPVAIAFNNPWPKEFGLPVQELVITDDWVKDISRLNESTKSLRTNYSEDYFRWRYVANPNEKYYYLRNLGEVLNYGAFFRFKKVRFGLELRVCDLLLNDNTAGTQFKAHLKVLAKQAGATYISISSPMAISGFIKLPLGPIVTLNYLSDKINQLNFQTWNPTLGDLEMF